MTSTHVGLASAHLNSVQHTEQYLIVTASVHRSGISINSPSQWSSGKRSLWRVIAPRIIRTPDALTSRADGNHEVSGEDNKNPRRLRSLLRVTAGGIGFHVSNFRLQSD